MENTNVNVPIGEICKLEDEFKLEVQKLKEKLNPDMATEMDELYNKMMVKMRYTMYRIMLSFPNNPDVNGFANEVVKMLMIYTTDPEVNLTNHLLGTQTDANLDVSLANLEMKVEEVIQDSTEIVLSSVASNDYSQLQPSTSAHSSDEAMIPAINQLPQSITPVLEQKANNRPVVIEPPAAISKEDTWKMLPREPATCFVKDCGTKFDYRRIRQDHIEKDHQNTRVWHCALCHKHYTTYTTLDRHYLKEHAFHYQCTFASCTFTYKIKRQVTKHFEECHMISVVVNNPEDKSANQNIDVDLVEDEANPKANVQPINQGSPATLPSLVASGSEDINELPIKQLSTLAEPKSTKRLSVQSGSNEEGNQVYEHGQGQSSPSVKKAKLDSTYSNNTQSNVCVDQSRRITEHCGLSFDDFDDPDQHTKLVHSDPQVIRTEEYALTTFKNANAGKGPIVSQQSSITTEPTSIHFEVPVGFRLETRGNEECSDVGDQGQSSSPVNNAKLDAAHSDHAQSQVTNVSEQNSKVNYNSTEEVPQPLNRDAMLIRIGVKCFKLNCKRMFDTEKKLNLHMWKKHRIRAFPCLVKDCGKSFDDVCNRNEHFNKDHKDRSKWRCVKCWNNYESLQGLSAHYNCYHRNQYQCTFSSCSFTDGDISSTVYHYVQEHMITCRQVGCANKFYGFIYKRHADVDREKQAKRLHYHYQPINQGSTASVSSHVASCDGQ